MALGGVQDRQVGGRAGGVGDDPCEEDREVPEEPAGGRRLGAAVVEEAEREIAAAGRRGQGEGVVGPLGDRDRIDREACNPCGETGVQGVVLEDQEAFEEGFARRDFARRLDAGACR